MGFSDDCHHFALSGWGLALLMGVCAIACATACSSAQVHKLKVCCVRLDRCRMWYMQGKLPTSPGPLNWQTEGFMLTGVMVMGDQPRESLPRPRPTWARSGGRSAPCGWLACWSGEWASPSQYPRWELSTRMHKV